MSYTLLITILAVLCYFGAAGLLWRRLSRGAGKQLPSKLPPIILGFIGAGLHAGILYSNIFTLAGINFGFFHALSLIFWLIVLLLLVTAVSKPVENLGIAILPLAGGAILLEYFIPSVHFLPADERHLEIHIFLSVIAFSMLNIAAVQAVLLAIQDQHLHDKRPGGFIRLLPPLQTMETLLFQMIGLGFILQTLSLLTGFLYLDDLFAQHLAHKTVLSIVAWLVFAILLWGRWRFGWRGKTAIRWTLWGFISLALAYLGSKLVLEIFLGN